MSSSKPAIILDIDGVINAITKKPDRTIWPEWSQEIILGENLIAYPMWVASAVVNFWNRLDGLDVADIYWHTTWQGYANERVAPSLGLPVFPVLDAPEYLISETYTTQWWKVPAVLRLKDEGRRILWIDDDIPYMNVPDGPWMTLSPRENTGLTPKHLRIIAGFVDVDPDELLI